MTAQVAQVHVLGGGPAGACAALAARALGAHVRIDEKSRVPRHKVCGEFLGPEIRATLEELGIWSSFLAAKPTQLERVVLHFDDHVKSWRLPDPAFGLSRRTLDALLLDLAVRRGAQLEVRRSRASSLLDGGASDQGSGTEPDGVDRLVSVARASPAVVVAHGRRAEHLVRRAPIRDRLFGFKCHYRGARDAAPNDAVELHFIAGGYIGASDVDGGCVNVCGLCSESSLRAHGFHPEALFPRALDERLGGRQPAFEWLWTGPIELGLELRRHARAYLAGDALGFVDPFTGSGITSAMLTGALAGRAASHRVPLDTYYSQCRHALRRQYGAATLLRHIVGSKWTMRVARWIPGDWLYRLTRPGAAIRA